jgi:antitoxin FitA
MASITIEIQDSQLQKLQDLANLHGVSPEVLLSAGLKDWLSQQQSELTNAADYVLEKNTELYRRLA